jgi:DNA-binding response OmpR family regulator
MNVVVLASEVDPATARLLAALRNAGHAVRVVTGSGEALLACRSSHVDIVVGARELSALRSRLVDVPVAAWLSAASSAATAELLEEGADEVIHSGMSAREQLARLTALLRRVHTLGTLVELGPLRVDLERGEATWHGRRLGLTARERAVLHSLARAGGATVRRETLYREVWGYAMARGDRTVDVNVKRLRDKLASSIGAPIAIETETGVGYRLAIADHAVTAL